MALPQQIPVRYSEEEAGYVTMRPVVKQTFRIDELTDMVVSVAGKDTARIQQIFRTGTVVYNGYRYWWESIAADLGEIEPLLAPFPDDDPSRPFDAGKVTAILLESGGGTQHRVAEISRQEASRKRIFGNSSPWDILDQSTNSQTPRYEKYSYLRRADLFRITLPYELAQELLASMLEAAPRTIRRRWLGLRPPTAITFVCPR